MSCHLQEGCYFILNTCNYNCLRFDVILQQQPHEVLEFLFSSSLINLLEEEHLGHRIINNFNASCLDELFSLVEFLGRAYQHGPIKDT